MHRRPDVDIPRDQRRGCMISRFLCRIFYRNFPKTCPVAIQWPGRPLDERKTLAEANIHDGAAIDVVRRRRRASTVRARSEHGLGPNYRKLSIKVKQHCSGQFPGWEDGIAELRTFVVKQLWSGDLERRKKLKWFGNRKK